MSKTVVINFGHGDLYTGFKRVTAQLWTSGHCFPEQFTGSLPPVPELIDLYRNWQSIYRHLCDIRSMNSVHARQYINLRSTSALQLQDDDELEIEQTGITNISIYDFDDLCQKLPASMNAWLKTEGILNISLQLRALLNPTEEIRIIIETNDEMMRRLPWHRCHFWSDFPKAEIALSQLEYKRCQPAPKPRQTPTVRILAILGNSQGIDLQTERNFLQQIPDAEVVFLVQPSRQEFNSQLWHPDGWDMLFFAGHSQTEGETGRIYINEEPTNNSLQIEQLEEALKAAIQKGLKLAIFNSCDGLGLASPLEKLHIPTIIVMREPVPNLIAQEFFKYFLQAFAFERLSLYLSVQQARRKLQGLENDFPGASWLPIICQNPAVESPHWLDLIGTQNEVNLDINYLPKSTHTETVISSKNQDWGEAIDIPILYGRNAELTKLSQWILHDKCRLITLIGMGGIGKTSLSVRIAEQVQDEFAYVIWRSLRNAPPISELLADLISFFSHQQETELPDSISGKISRLQHYLRSNRCLLILDNVESILSSEVRAGTYLQGYEGYGQLFRCIGETKHQSCLLLTSREKPRDISVQESSTSLVRSLQLSGLNQDNVQEILLEKCLHISADESYLLANYYAGNPLALKIVATTIKELFDGNIAEFLQQGTIIFGDVFDLLDQQFNRLTFTEEQVMYWLAINRELVSLTELQQDIIPANSPRDLLEALESLKLRSLIDNQTGKFTQQPVVMEYVTDRLITQVCTEIFNEEVTLVNKFALIKATAKDFVRNAQIQLILKPLVLKLFNYLGSQESVEIRLQNVLLKLRSPSLQTPGYAGGNLLNLLWQLQANLSNYDFSNLIIWQAYLQGMNLQQVNFANSDLSKSVFTRTSGGFLAASFSPDGKLLATGIDNEICVWEVANFRQIITFTAHTASVQALTFSPDGQILASGSNDQTVRLWNLQTGQCLKTLRGHTSGLQSLAFSPDGQILASGSNDQTVRLWDVQIGQCCRILHGHTSRVIFTSFIGQKLVTGSQDHTVRVWDTTTGNCLQILHTNINWILSIALSPDGQTLVTGSDETTVKFWDLDSGKCIKTLSGNSQIWAVAFSPDGKKLATATENKTVKIWNLPTGECWQTLHEHNDRVWLVAFNPDNHSLVSVSESQTMKLWDIETGQCLRTVDGYINWVFSVAFSPNGKFIASSSQDQIVRLWDVATGKCLHTMQGHTNLVSSVTFVPQNQEANYLLASGSDDTSIKIWDTRTRECVQTIWGHESWVHAVSFSPNGKLLASGSRDHTIKLWDWQTGECLNTLVGHVSQVKTIAFNSECTMLVSGSDDNYVKLWDVDSGRCLQTLLGHQDWVLSVAFSPKDNIIASASGDKTIKLWDIRTGVCLQTLSGHTYRVRTVAFSSDGQILASGADDQTIKFWHVSTGENITTFTGHQKAVRSIAFSPDDSLLVSSSEDETIQIWDVQTGTCLSVMKIDKPYEGMNIKNTIGLTVSQKNTLKALGAVEK